LYLDSLLMLYIVGFKHLESLTRLIRERNLKFQEIKNMEKEKSKKKKRTNRKNSRTKPQFHTLSKKGQGLLEERFR